MVVASNFSSNQRREAKEMKRDQDFIRDILLKIEGGQGVFETCSREAAEILRISSELSREEAEKLSGHLDLLEDDGLIKIESRGAAGVYLIKGLTSKGHSYLHSIRA